MKQVETKTGLKELLRRYKKAQSNGVDLGAYGIENYWVKVIEGCIQDNLTMDETDYENTPKQLRVLWNGLK